MKLTTSFAPPLGRLALPLAAALWLGALLLVAAAAALVWHRAALQAGQHRLDARLAQARERRRVVELAEPVPRGALEHLQARVARVNALLGAGDRSAVAGLQALEQALPRQARLVSLRLDADVGTATLVAEAPGSAALTGLLERLERAAPFEAPRLVQQQAVGPAGERAVRAELEVRWNGS